MTVFLSTVFALDELWQADVCELEFPDNSFDTVVTVCTFCSVPRPVAGLRELYRVLKPCGQILMFEHVRSRKIIEGIKPEEANDLQGDHSSDISRAGREFARPE